jgi:hypothetical protein
VRLCRACSFGTTIDVQHVTEAKPHPQKKSRRVRRPGIVSNAGTRNVAPNCGWFILRAAALAFLADVLRSARVALMPGERHERP